MHRAECYKAKGHSMDWQKTDLDQKLTCALLCSLAKTTCAHHRKQIAVTHAWQQFALLAARKTCKLSCTGLKKSILEVLGSDLGITVQAASSTHMHITREETEADALGSSNLLAFLHQVLPFLQKDILEFRYCAYTDQGKAKEDKTRTRSFCSCVCVERDPSYHFQQSKATETSCKPTGEDFL